MLFCVQVLAWKENLLVPTDEGEWIPATLKGITETGYQVQFNGNRDVIDLSPDRVRPEGTPSRACFFQYAL